MHNFLQSFFDIKYVHKEMNIHQMYYNSCCYAIQMFVSILCVCMCISTEIDILWGNLKSLIIYIAITFLISEKLVWISNNTIAFRVAAGFRPFDLNAKS